LTSNLPPLEPGTVLLETGRPDDENQQSLLFRNPVEVLQAHNTPSVPALLAELDRKLAEGFYVAGYLDYECGYAFEAFAPFESAGRPFAWFGVYREPELWPVFQRDRSGGGATAGISSVEFSWTRKTYREAFDRTHGHLFEGDVYQINLTGKFSFPYEGSPQQLYHLLKQRQGVAYNALILTEHEAIISCSPELFFRRDGKRVWSRPMKGTAPRGRTSDEDHRRAVELAADPKSQAENLMIVDLLRNDLSRVATTDSVHVPELFATERYDTVIQMTSTIEAEVSESAGYADLFRALFPCGSVTGAPKIRAMQLIRDLESAPRGVYTGTIGYAAPSGRATFNVAIRTVQLSNGRGTMGSGGGIVWDSQSDSEYDECLLKGRFLTRDEPEFELIETLTFDNGLQRLDRHIDRLLSSADYFGFALDPRVILKALDESVSEVRGPTKVRLLVSKDGSMKVETGPVDVGGDDPTVVLSRVPVDSADRFLFHKTTRRELYRTEYEIADAAGHLDAIFLNERGEVTEGSRTNLYVQTNGELVTPPVSCGLLPGTVRQELIDAGKATERILSADDLADAEAVFVSNAILGLRQVRVVL